MSSIAVEAPPSVTWSWLYGKRDDLFWNFAFFWASFFLAGLLWLMREGGDPSTNSAFNWNLGGHEFQLAAITLSLYGPLVDAPHLWATISRTYLDREEWARRKSLFLGAFAWLFLGPAMVLGPYLLAPVFGWSDGVRDVGFLIFFHFVTLYALQHIAKQHWGFVALYRRKNEDTQSADIDRRFFLIAIWLPYVALITDPGYSGFSLASLPGLEMPAWWSASAGFLHAVALWGFVVLFSGYAVYQIKHRLAGGVLNGPKLIYVATILLLYFVSFAIDPVIAAFWVVLTGTGHCAQYHRVVWGYGRKHYVDNGADEGGLPGKIFRSAWLYIGLGLLFAVVTLQGPGRGLLMEQLGAATGGIFSFAGEGIGALLMVKVIGAAVSGIRLHHFYVDGKIWKVSKDRSVAQALRV